MPAHLQQHKNLFLEALMGTSYGALVLMTLPFLKKTYLSLHYKVQKILDIKLARN